MFFGGLMVVTLGLFLQYSIGQSPLLEKPKGTTWRVHIKPLFTLNPLFSPRVYWDFLIVTICHAVFKKSQCDNCHVKYYLTST